MVSRVLTGRLALGDLGVVEVAVPVVEGLPGSWWRYAQARAGRLSSDCPAAMLIEKAQGADLLVVVHRGRGGLASAQPFPV